jgi:glutamate/tyrosine decarboxylase-like PLP-dependent enzyme
MIRHSQARRTFGKPPSCPGCTVARDNGLFNSFSGFVNTITRLRDSTNGDKILERATEEQTVAIKKFTVRNSARSLEDVVEETHAILSQCWKLGHPRFFSFIPSTASIISSLGEILTSFYNPFAGNSEAGSSVCAAEQGLIEWLAQQFGLPPSAGGHFVSGGSMANLTALTVARDQKLDEVQRTSAVIYISDQTHFCISKALKIIGFAKRHIRVISTDESFRMNLKELRETILADLRSDLCPFAIVATCGTTNTGAVDPLNEIAAIAEAYGLWMHVDGAYGASAAFCASRRHLVDGLGKADSIAWDAHKWLFQTNGCGAVLFRNRKHPLRSFAATASYVQEIDDDSSLLQNPWNYGIELTRPARHMKLWFTLQILGLDSVDRMIYHGFNLADLAHSQLQELDDWEILSPAGLAIITFRYAPYHSLSESAIGMLNTLISKNVVASNIAAIFTTQLKGKVSLRMCTINPQTTEEDIIYVIQSLDRIARETLQSTDPGNL